MTVCLIKRLSEEYLSERNGLVKQAVWVVV